MQKDENDGEADKQRGSGHRTTDQESKEGQEEKF